jgi:hypothetical protein
MAQKREKVDMPNRDRPAVKLTAMPQANPLPNRQAWLARLAHLRQHLLTGKPGLTVEQILDEDRDN